MKTTPKDKKLGSRKALEYSTIIRLQENGRNVEIVTRSINGARTMVSVVEGLERIARSRVPLFCHPNQAGSIRKKAANHPLEKVLLHLLQVDHKSIKVSFPTHRFHPLLELFWKHFFDLIGTVKKLSPALGKVLHEAVENFRGEAKSPQQRALRDTYVRWARDSTNNLYDYIDALFEVHSRYLVIRVDLGYRRDALKLGRMDALPISYEQVRRHREELLACLKTWKVPMHGYAWSLNHAASKGFHYHMLFFFDANEGRNDYVIGEEIGQRWMSITNGEGTYNNCNAHKYPEHGIGRIHVEDEAAMRALKFNVAPYLTKPDYYIRLVVPHGHVFDHGNMRKIRGRKRGRPRYKSVRAAGVGLPD